MPDVPVPHSDEQFLREPHFAVVATLQPDGAPHTAMTWYDWDDGRILVNMDHSRLRLRFLGTSAPRRSSSGSKCLSTRRSCVWMRRCASTGHKDPLTPHVRRKEGRSP